MSGGHQDTGTQRRGAATDAERQFRDILTREPHNLSALYRLGFLCGREGRFGEAEALMADAIALSPASADLHLLRGFALLRLDRLEEAVACLDEAVALQPEFTEALVNRAAALFRLKRFPAAAADYDRLLRLNPDYPYARGNRLFCRLQLCDWRERNAEIASIAAGLREGKRVLAPFDAKALPLSLEQQAACAAIWARDQTPQADAMAAAMGPYRHTRVRIAYVAAQFADDPVSCLLADVIAQHDRERFEIIGVAFRDAAHGFRHPSLSQAFDQRISGAGLNDAALAEKLRAQQIDIAIDLMGYTEGGRPGVFAFRVAPVQVNYLGFPGTLAMPQMDYITADRTVIPEADVPHYSERVARLPGSFMPMGETGGPREPMSRRDAGLPPTGFVFASFNSYYKITPEMFDIWMRLLSQIEGSLLWLPKSQPEAAANLQRAAEASGIARPRLIFAPYMPDRAAHLARLSLTDLLLDTLPYNAHSTAIDALRAGVPVLTCRGEGFAGHVAASLLHAVGLSELVTSSLDAYEAAALHLARNPAALASFRARLANTVLFDAARYARHLEAVYLRMWERAEHGLAPESFAVEKVA